MDLKIIKKQDNPLLSRKEIEAEANFSNEATPKKEDIKKKIVAMEKAEEKLVVIKNIHTSFSSGKANVLAYIYKSEKELKRIEPKKKEKKGAKPAEGESAKEAPKEETKEAPKEEAKETPKEEPKKEPPKKE